MFFTAFPTVYYYFNDPDKETLATTITRRARLARTVINNISLFDEYYIRDGDTPEMLAFKAYGEPQYHWIILMCNDIIDPFEQWPKTDSGLVEYCKKVYGENNLYAIHHYVDSKNNWIPTGTTQQSVTNLQHEIDINDAKKIIKLPKKEYINQIIAEHQKVYQDV